MPSGIFVRRGSEDAREGTQDIGGNIPQAGDPEGDAGLMPFIEPSPGGGSGKGQPQAGMSQPASEKVAENAELGNVRSLVET